MRLSKKAHHILGPRFPLANSDVYIGSHFPSSLWSRLNIRVGHGSCQKMIMSHYKNSMTETFMQNNPGNFRLRWVESRHCFFILLKKWPLSSLHGLSGWHDWPHPPVLPQEHLLFRTVLVCKQWMRESLFRIGRHCAQDTLPLLYLYSQSPGRAPRLHPGHDRT